MDETCRELGPGFKVVFDAQLFLQDDGVGKGNTRDPGTETPGVDAKQKGTRAVVIVIAFKIGVHHLHDVRLPVWVHTLDAGRKRGHFQLPVIGGEDVRPIPFLYHGPMIMKDIRIFIGSPVEDPQGVLWQHCSTVRQKNPRWRIVQRDSWHITVAFPGNIDPARLPEIAQKTQMLARAYNPLHLHPDRLVFMPVHKPSMLWLKMKANDAFNDLFYAFHHELGLIPSHPPNPHVTLMRGDFGRLDPASIETPDLGSLHQHLRSINIYRSFMQPGGSRYEVLESFVMG